MSDKDWEIQSFTNASFCMPRMSFFATHYSIFTSVTDHDG